MNIFITGGAGYIGGMLCDQFSRRDDIEYIVAIDKNPRPSLLDGNDKIIWIDGNTSDNHWQEIVDKYKPEVVINTAWQIREMYGQKETQWKWNVDGAQNVYDFAFSRDYIDRFVHFSTVSSYGAYKENTLEEMFTEDMPFLESEYLYGIEKKVAEENLKTTYEQAKERGRVPQVFIVRPAAITGPRGRFMFERFGLQAALKGDKKNTAIPGFVKAMVKLIPITGPQWCRQFIHEDDVCDIMELFTFTKDLEGEYEVFNISPNSYVLGPDMAEVMKKKILRVPAPIARMAFFTLWHLTRGKVPTAKGGWRFYTYPIVVDGSKLTNKYGFTYRCTSREALEKTIGRYEYSVPEGERVS